MKIVLEFDSAEEHDAYIRQRTSEHKVNIGQEVGYAPPPFCPLSSARNDDRGQNTS